VRISTAYALAEKSTYHGPPCHRPRTKNSSTTAAAALSAEIHIIFSFHVRQFFGHGWWLHRHSDRLNTLRGGGDYTITVSPRTHTHTRTRAAKLNIYTVRTRCRRGGTRLNRRDAFQREPYWTSVPDQCVAASPLLSAADPGGEENSRSPLRRTGRTGPSHTPRGHATGATSK